MSPQTRPVAIGLLTASLCLTGVACSDPASMPPTGPDDTPVAFELSLQEYVSRIKALGFRTDMIEDRGTYFIIEGDIALDKSYLAALPANVREDWFRLNPSQWRTFNTVNSPEYHNVDISQLAGEPAWESAATQAVAQWNQLSGTRVRMFTGACPNCALRTVLSFYNEACTPDGCTLAVAAFPAGGVPGRTIRINLSFNVGNGPNGEPTAAAKLNTLVHELGHTVGFRHTNWQNNPCVPGSEGEGAIGAVLIPGTPETDDESVMNGCTANRDWAGFSYWDRAAARVLYTGWGPFNQSGSVESGYPRLSWSATTDAQYYNVYWWPPGHCETFYDEQGWPQTQCYGSTVSYFVGSTTDTWFVDTSRSTSGVRPCAAEFAHYTVSTVFPVAGETIKTAEGFTYGACFY